MSAVVLLSGVRSRDSRNDATSRSERLGGGGPLGGSRGSSGDTEGVEVDVEAGAVAGELVVEPSTVLDVELVEVEVEVELVLEDEELVLSAGWAAAAGGAPVGGA